MSQEDTSSRLARRYRYTMALFVDTTSRRVDITLRRVRQQSFAREFVPLAALFLVVTGVFALSTLTYVPAWLLSACVLTVPVSGLSLLFRPSKQVVLPLLPALPETGDLTYLARVCRADTGAAQDLLRAAWQACDVHFPGTCEQRDAIMAEVIEKLAASGTLAQAGSDEESDPTPETATFKLTCAATPEDLPYDDNPPPHPLPSPSPTTSPVVA